MPVILNSAYKAPFILFNNHLQTLIPGLFRSVKDIKYIRERIDTPDEDFLNLDWSCHNSKKLAILSHGMEGDSNRSYIKGMVRELNKNGWDALAWNYRSCGGEINNNVRMYHGGVTDDLTTVVIHAITKKGYKEISLIGFSLGGNLTLKYLGEHSKKLPKQIKIAVVFSVPIDLAGSMQAISDSKNYIYEQGLLRTLKRKIKVKRKLFPKHIPTKLELVDSLKSFIDIYSTALHGFKDANSHYKTSSSKNYLGNIRIPTLIINAKNDPILSADCFPYELAEKSAFVYLEVPDQGGHVGFIQNSLHGTYWSEERAIRFINN